MLARIVKYLKALCTRKQDCKAVDDHLWAELVTMKEERND